MPLGIVIAVGGVSDAELSEAAQVVVEEGMMAPTRFALVYPADISGGDLPRLVDARLGPGSEILVTADTPGGPACLVKGPVHGQRIVLAHGGEGSSVEVRGSDTSIAMDRETKTAVWSDATDSEAVAAILGAYGYVPDIEATAARHVATKHPLVQRASDLQFVRMLARRNGAGFWITCDPLGVETAHFRRPVTTAPASLMLGINQEKPSVTEVEIEWDVETPSTAIARGIEPAARSVLTGDAMQSPLSPLGPETLDQLRPGPHSVHIAPPADDAGDLAARAEGALIEAGWFVRARCRTSVEAAGGVVRAHSVVALSGAGSRHSGGYYVAGVRHVIDAEAHRMELTLVRNAWGSNGTGP